MTEVASKVFKPNSLIAYKGGCYEGCFYEWNYSFIDDSGQFHDIYSSGRYGCSSLEDLESAYECKPQDFEITDVTNPEELQRFSDREALSNVMGCAKFFVTNGLDIVLKLRCSDCGQGFPAAIAEVDEVVCDGGVHLTVGSVVCQECHDHYCCGRCWDYMGSTYPFQESKHYTQVCESCLEEDGPSE